MKALAHHQHGGASSSLMQRLWTLCLTILLCKSQLMMMCNMPNRSDGWVCRVALQQVDHPSSRRESTTHHQHIIDASTLPLYPLQVLLVYAMPASHHHLQPHQLPLLLHLHLPFYILRIFIKSWIQMIIVFILIGRQIDDEHTHGPLPTFFNYLPSQLGREGPLGASYIHTYMLHPFLSPHPLHSCHSIPFLTSLFLLPHLYIQIERNH